LYEIIFTRTAAKELDALDLKLAERVVSFLEKVAESPRSKGGALKGGLKGMWRYRLGKLRILTTIDDEKKILLIHHILWRKDAYKE